MSDPSFVCEPDGANEDDIWQGAIRRNYGWREVSGEGG